MFGIGFMELCLIATVALVFVGPNRLPELIKQLSRVFVHMRHMSTEVKGTINQALADAEQEMQAEKAVQHIQEILSAPSGVEAQEPITSVANTDTDVSPHSEDKAASEKAAES